MKSAPKQTKQTTLNTRVTFICKNCSQSQTISFLLQFLTNKS